ncbi:hypothetical protein [Lentilactobacillus parakefiri]|uniref:Uncharacterized protein n=1 Tax=Lentilactobacillus parakefiri TaxID=152332 RepID=A0A224VEN9_9LACO|nr:hypothetical protein [Lentilactobacillus parakefiri]KRL70622.1 hypothetical protein FD08_GL001103 [Lentilactobacillus parakefiri DSM 10551]PAL00546.1 hypothetical protein B8W96_06055 [Lentilactobacillus parakefiri]TDG88046.1 hypothetical protein C5L28_002459 [Lentilactobacillus parakefiri]GAW73355.1 hypothetical protein LPKJCM_02499 [Lentilactobacillus parakefiri]
MKKWKILLGTVALFLGLLFVSGSLNVVSASSRNVPSNMRGYWYYYEGHGKYYRIKFTKRMFYSWEYKGHGSWSMQRFAVNAYKSHHKGWYTIGSPKKEMGAPEMYKYSPKKINGRLHKSLQFRTGTMYYRYFKTKVPHSFNKFGVPSWY